MKKVTEKSGNRKDKKDGNRYDFENNQDVISTAFFKLISKDGKVPTMTKLAETTNLSYKTIERHLKTPSFTAMRQKLRAFNDMMLVQFAQKVSKSGNPAMWDMYFTLTEPEYAETKNKKNVDVTSKGKAIQQLSISVIDADTKKAIDEL